MVAYRTDKPLSRVKGGSNVMSCEDFVKDCIFKTSKGEAIKGQCEFNRRTMHRGNRLRADTFYYQC